MQSRNPKHRAFKASAYGVLARIGEGLAHAKRLEILDLLAQRPWSVEELARELALPPANVSQHLRILRDARLVEVQRQGRRALYRLAGAGVLGLLGALHALGEARLPELDRLLKEHVGERPVRKDLDPTQAVRKARAGELVLLDVRPEEEYRAGHLPGALSVPVERLETFLGRLPKDRPILVYCRGRYCTLADEAVQRLRALGYRVWRLEGGPWAWRPRGLWEGEEVGA